MFVFLTQDTERKENRAHIPLLQYVPRKCTLGSQKYKNQPPLGIIALMYEDCRPLLAFTSPCSNKISVDFKYMREHGKIIFISNLPFSTPVVHLRLHTIDTMPVRIRVTLQWVCTTGHLTRRRRLQKPSTGSCKQRHSHRPWFSWGTSTTLTSAGKTIQLGSRSPGGSYRALMITF